MTSLRHHAYVQLPSPEQILRFAGTQIQPWRVPQLCASYGLPMGTMPGGGVIGIVELGGGYTWNDVGRFCGGLNMPVPKISAVSVDAGAGNSPGQLADTEVLLDIEVAAAVYSYCTGQPATIRMYFANNDLDGITRAIMKATDEAVDVLSISWGSDETNWGLAAAQRLETAAAAAAARGMVVFAASGDNDSADSGAGSTNVDLPAAAPHILGCGGTMRPHRASVSNPERVWNLNPGNADGEGTGGGFSMFFPMSSWMNGAPGQMRMVPDVAANADPTTGYYITYQGQDAVVGGTSAVAPFYAGAIASVGRKLGFISPKLWMNNTVFNDIKLGDNGFYRATDGPDPCTGLGTPRGAKLLSLLANP